MPTKSLPKEQTKTMNTKKNALFTIGIISPIQSLDGQILIKGFEGFCELGFKTNILAEGDSTSQKKCLEYLETYPENFSIHESILSEKQNIIEKSDIIVFTHKPSKSEINATIKNSTPCVIPNNCGLENFNPQTEMGEAFTFELGNFWSFMSAVIRANENKKFAYDWRILKKNLAKL